MRIIAGHARGIRLSSPPEGVRPTTDRVKESLFGSLEPIVGLQVVDLFSGSGALGLEALSRGAASVDMVERDRRTARLIEVSLAAVEKSMRAAGATPGEARVHLGDALAVPRLLPSLRPDIVLADPPYEPKAGDKGGVALLEDEAFAAWLGQGLLVLEQGKRGALTVEVLKRWSLQRERKIGDTVLYYLHVR